MSKLRPACAVPLCLLLVAGCAAPPRVQTIQSGDATLDCAQLHRELASVEQLRAQAEKDSGMTPTNAMLALLFVPVAMKSMSDAQDAARAAAERKKYLAGLIEYRRCGPDRLQPAATTIPSQPTTGS